MVKYRLPKPSLWAILRLVLFAWFGLAIVLYAFQSRLIYMPNRSIGATPDEVGLSYQDITLTTSDDVRIHGWYLPRPQARATLLFFHGNAGNISHRLESLQIFHRLALNVLIIDYRGYGRSEGKPDEQGTYRDAEAGWAWLVNQQHIAPAQIVIFGRSLGGGIAAWLAARRHPGAVILESTFTSIPELATTLYPYLPRWLSRFNYANIEQLPSIDSPIWIGHSRDDELIPYTQGKRLYAVANHPKRFFEMNGPHSHGFLITGNPYQESLGEFLDELF